VSPTPEPPDFDLDEDLFDFAEVAHEPEPSVGDEDLDRVFASLRDSIEEEELLLGFAAPSTPVAGAPSPLRLVTTEAQPDAQHGAATERLPASLAPRSLAPQPEPVRPPPASPTVTASAAAVEPLLPVTEAHVEPPAPLPASIRKVRSPSFTRSLVGIALAVTVINSAVAVKLMRGRGDTAHAEGERAQDHVPDATAAATHPSAALPDPGTLAATSSHPALDAARAEIARGEYATARQRVYGLLAIIDRLEEPRKSALEADCQYLVAQTLHLEALARMGGGR
jgi:hypothetical protein